MSGNFPYFLADAAEEVQALRRNWFWLVGLGAAMVFVGLFAVSYPVAATIATVELFGIVLLASGALEVASGLWAKGWGGFFCHLICGLLSVFVGAVLIDRPLIGAEVYTVLLAVFFVASGLFRAITSATRRFSGWGWGVLSGGVTFLLGLMIWRQLPGSELWVIGLLVGIDCVFNGWSWVMLGMAARSLPSKEGAPEYAGA